MDSGSFLRNDGDPMLSRGSDILPTLLLTGDRDISFDGLTTGDLVEVIIGDVPETPIATAQVYPIRKLSDGSMTDIPAETVERLAGMGIR